MGYGKKGNNPISVDVSGEVAGRLDGVDTQLAETAVQDLKRNISDSSTLSVGSKPDKRPLVTFIDDDGYTEVVTRMKPIFDARGVKGTLAIVSDWVGRTTSGNMTKEQIAQLQREGWEIASHEKTHIGMSGITDDASVYREIIQSKEDLLKMGFNVKNLVYPFGQNNAKVIEYAKRAYRGAVITNAPSNDTTVTFPLDTFSIRRVDFSQNTLAHYKSVVDKAVSENSWVIFMTHMKVQTPEHDQILADLLDYIQSINVEIVTMDEGMDTFADKMTVDGSFRILPDNSVSTEKFVVGMKDTLLEDVTKASDINFILSNYREGSIVYSKFSTVRATGLPENKAGILTTFIETSEKGYISQKYRIYNTGLEYYRCLKSMSEWTEWVAIGSGSSSGGGLSVIGTKDGATNASAITAFESGKITYMVFSGSGATTGGMPEGKAGTLVTNRISSEVGYQRQQYNVYNNGNTYDRYLKTDGTWSTWTLRTKRLPVVLETYTFGEVPAQSTVERIVTVSGATAFDNAIVNPTSSPEQGIAWSSRVQAGAVVIRVTNVKNTAVTMASNVWRITVISN